MAMKRYVLTVGDEVETTLANLLPKLDAAGFIVDKTLGAIGVIVGRADEEDLDRIRDLPGVAAIDEDHIITG
ncbi:MAG: hypothetical protein IT183_05735 [Acidobacteria bacterium]|nr:hypothetical protein [Acidobacteriota bacterium]